MTTSTTPLLRTEKQRDANFLSLNSNTAVWYAGTPDEREHLGPLPTYLIPDIPKEWDSALKCSGRKHTHLRGLVVSQCKENAGDCNNETAHCSFEGDFGVVGFEGEQVWTTKGGSHDLAHRGRIYSRGRRADYCIGLWSDQCFKPSYNLDYSGLTPAGTRANEPLTFILCRVNQPWRAWFGLAPKDIQLPDGARVLKLKSLGAQIHWWAKLVIVKTGLIKWINI